MQRTNATNLELWGGIECTRNRVGDQSFDQLVWSGHDRRPGDIDRIAALGIRKLRYPVLWEQAAPERPEEYNWSWSDERLPLLKSWGIEPIVGLVHHGSGPFYTNLLDPSFATGLATYAGHVAERYPWVAAYTPVNEPLTTARFSGLYGVWYPHLRSNLAFAQAFLNQCRAVVLSMRAIRTVNSSAKLIQTEDLGKTYGSPALQYQVDFENERRWLTFDLLSGRVDQHHPVGHFLLWLGIPEADLLWFRESPCPPDVIGINHYLTSDRYLDDRLDRYPQEQHGGNGEHAYVDVEAIRVREDGPIAPDGLMLEAWKRFQLPLAITEAHLGCTREEQVRWLWELWQAAGRAREQGADVRAVTVWSLLGAYNWNSLMTRADGVYEPGVFDVRGPEPRPTALAEVVRGLANGNAPNLAPLAQPGWWRRPERLLGMPSAPANLLPGRPILITGATGTLGRAFARVCEGRALPYRLLSRPDMDIADRRSVARVFERYNPWAVINAAGYVRVDDAEDEPSECFRSNVRGSTILGAACARLKIPFVTFSSDLVFDGGTDRPYRESDSTSPLCVYGRCKAEAERRVLILHPRTLVVRTSAFFGPWDHYNFVHTLIQQVESNGYCVAASDLVCSPTYVPDLAHRCLDLLIDGASGIWHLTNGTPIAWADLARKVVERAGFDAAVVHVRKARTFRWKAVRPAYSALTSERGGLLPDLDDALTRCFNERQWIPRASEIDSEPASKLHRVEAPV